MVTRRRQVNFMKLSIWSCPLVHPVAHINPFPAKVTYLNFHPPEVVSRYRDPQLQAGENYSYLLKHFGPNNLITVI